MKISNILSHRKVTILIFGLILTILAFSLLFSSRTNAQSDAPGKPEIALVATGTGFTYQGQLNQSNVLANGSFSFQFALYDSATGGTQIGTTQTETIVVSNGLFTVLLNDAGEFGTSAFNGEARYLEITVDSTLLTPRQALTAAPYAHSLRPGATISGSGTGGAILNLIESGSGSGLFVESTLTGVEVRSDGKGVHVSVAGNPSSLATNSLNHGFEISGAEGDGLFVGSATNGVNVVAASEDGVHVGTVGGDGLEVESAVNGVNVASASSIGVYVGSAVNGVQVDSASGIGVAVVSAVNGVQLDSATNTGVYVGSATTGVWVDGPVSGFAGFFTGDVNVTGTCTGCLLATFGVNTSDSSLQPGDVVSLQGTSSGESIGQPLLMEVGLAQAGSPMVGVVYGHGELVEVEGANGQMISQLVPREGAAQAGDYVQIVIYGPMQVNASTLGNAIQLGDRLSVNDSGLARSLETRELDGMSITESAPTIGMALEGLDADQDGLIWVLVNPQ